MDQVQNGMNSFSSQVGLWVGIVFIGGFFLLNFLLLRKRKDKQSEIDEAFSRACQMGKLEWWKVSNQPIFRHDNSSQSLEVRLKSYRFAINTQTLSVPPSHPEFDKFNSLGMGDLVRIKTVRLSNPANGNNLGSIATHLRIASTLKKS